MSLIAVSIAVRAPGELDSALRRAAKAVADGARLVEWRIDALAEESGGTAAVIKLVRQSPAPCIVTCRPTWEGGEYAGDEDARISLFEALAMSDHQPRYLDVELAAYKRSMNLRSKVNLAVEHGRQVRDLHTGLILSAHDHQGRPADLLGRIGAMVNEPACAVIKVAWQARSLRDNLEAFELLTERRKPMIALCMGPFGLMSRVLAGKFGALLTFASDHSTEVTAPGQPTVEELVKLYRFDRIGAQTKVYGVIGWPVAQSPGPVVHNAGFEAVGHDGVYLPMPIPTEYEHFKATVGAMLDFKPLHFRGASVTIPHKQNLLRFVKERGGPRNRVEPLAESIGAANTLIVDEDGSIECVNTDAPAVVDSLCAGMVIDRSALAGKKAAIIGVGGMARAAAVGLAGAGASVIIFNRTQDKARELAAELSKLPLAGKIVPGKQGRIDCGCFDIIINCTPMGMTGGPAPHVSPLPADMPLDENVTVMDTVYVPRETPFLKAARERGARTIGGLDMFIRQAALQFERWTGKKAPPGPFSERTVEPIEEP